MFFPNNQWVVTYSLWKDQQIHDNRFFQDLDF